MIKIRLLFAVCALPLAVLPARGDEGEWSRFRGPNGAGISEATTVPAHWTDKDYRWKVKLPGGGHSSPVLWGPRIYVTCDEAATARRTVLCLDAADGRTLWRRDYPSKTHLHHRDNSYASATPACDAEGVVVTWSTPEEVVLTALDGEGREVWRRGLGPYVGVHGSGASPVLYDALVVLPNDQEDPSLIPGYQGKHLPVGKSSLIAVDRKTGETRWKIDRRTSLSAYSTPCVYRPQGLPPELIFTGNAHGFTSVDPATGKVNWEIAAFGEDRCVGSPVLGAGLVIAASGYGVRGTHCTAVRPGSKTQGRQPAIAYDITRSVALVPTPLVLGDRLFLWADDGVVTCLSLSDARVIWRERVGGSFYGSPVCVNRRLYCVDRSGTVVVLAAADKFEVLARVPLSEPSFATPAVAGGVMYLRTVSQVFAIGGKK